MVIDETTPTITTVDLGLITTYPLVDSLINNIKTNYILNLIIISLLEIHYNILIYLIYFLGRPCRLGLLRKY